jgi:hypothetical protein
MIPGSRAVDGSASASGDNGGAGCASNSAASVTSLAALRRLVIFRILFSPARTTYALPILTIE